MPTLARPRAGLKSNVESPSAPPAVLTLSFEAEKADPYVVFKMSADLKCRDDNSKEVSVWKDSKEVARLNRSVLGNTPPKVLRDKVSRFYSPLIREYRQAATAGKQP